MQRKKIKNVNSAKDSLNSNTGYQIHHYLAFLLLGIGSICYIAWMTFYSYSDDFVEDFD